MDEPSFVQVLGDAGWHEREPGSSWPRAVGAALAVAVLLVAMLTGANVVINPRDEFPVHVFRPVLDDELRTKVDLLDKREGPLDSLVLGTSRAALLPPTPSAANGTGFNLAVGDSTVADAHLLYDYAVRTHGVPSTLVIGFDSFQLADDRTGPRKVPASPAAERITGEGPGAWDLARTAARSLTPGYALDDVRVLRFTLEGYPTPLREPGPDGTQHWIALEYHRAQGTFDAEAAFEAQWRSHLSQRYPTGAVPSQDTLDDLAALVHDALADGARVQVFLTPFHERALDRLAPSATFQEFQERSRAALDGLCADGAPVQVFDYTEAPAFGGDPRGFYDGYHIFPENAEILAQALAAGTGDRCVDGNA